MRKKVHATSRFSSNNVSQVYIGIIERPKVTNITAALYYR